METFCSNTVAFHLLLCCLDRASILRIMEVDGTAWMQRGPLLDIQNVWLCSETCFDAVSSLRDPCNSKTSSLLGHSTCLVNILQQLWFHETADNAKLTNRFLKLQTVYIPPPPSPHRPIFRRNDRATLLPIWIWIVKFQIFFVKVSIENYIAISSETFWLFPPCWDSFAICSPPFCESICFDGHLRFLLLNFSAIE